MDIRETIRKRRKEMKLTLRELSQRTGVREAAISKFENGKGDLYFSKSLKKILDELDIHEI